MSGTLYGAINLSFENLFKREFFIFPVLMHDEFQFYLNFFYFYSILCGF